MIQVTVVVPSFLSMAVAVTKPVATVHTYTGTPTVRHAGVGRKIPLKRGATLNAGDIVRNGPNTRVTLLYTNYSQLIKLDRNTTVEIAGQIWAWFRPGHGGDTESASLVTEGTEFNLEVKADGL